MSKVTIVTDSTAYIPKDLCTRYDIQVVPQVLIWGNETYADGVDIYPDEYYRRLSSAKIMPSTSQVSPTTFETMFQKLLNEDHEILAILVSEKLSGTIASAVQAKQNMPAAPIEIVDSYSVAMAMGFIALKCAKAANQGASLIECKELAEQARLHTGVVFAVETLEFLHRGGRIGGAARLLGTALNLKPILEVRNGRVEAVERVRTRKKSVARLIEIIEEQTAGKQPVRLATLHANAHTEALELLEQAKDRIGGLEHILSEVSPVVGTHAGPGTLGLAYLTGY